jgi:hypothetical protein
VICVLHEADEDASTETAVAVIYGLSVCGGCLESILVNVRAGDTYSADDYLTDAANHSWVSI